MNIISRCMTFFCNAWISSRDAWFLKKHKYLFAMHDFSRFMNIFTWCMNCCNAWISSRDSWTSSRRAWFFAIHKYLLMMREFLRCMNIFVPNEDSVSVEQHGELLGAFQMVMLSQLIIQWNDCSCSVSSKLTIRIKRPSGQCIISIDNTNEMTLRVVISSCLIMWRG